MADGEETSSAVGEQPKCFDRYALTLYCMFPLTQLAAASTTAVAAMVLSGPTAPAAFLAYLVWAWCLDNSPQRGGFGLFWRLGITHRLRGAFVWRWAARYFPVSMKPTASLPASAGPYIFVCHPHGIFGISPMTHFGTDATDFTNAFPDVPVHLLGHSAIFRIPFFREWCLAHGHGSVDRKTCLTLLQKGHSIALAPGGAKESLECKPRTMRLILANRKGFAKLALRTGAALVPVLAFGENELYSTVQFEPGTLSRRIQEALQRRLGFALPLFCGRKWLPLLPKRRPVSTVVGAPLRPPPGAGAPPAGGFAVEPAQEVVAEFHKQYCQALQELFDAHKAAHGAADMQLEIV
eukprot:CAMPEP_0115273916 /NCGR_PEP_ID=MMETSP0270-20121206/55397_1 /TAXON_ID=71861 /ORGANISM="Scrippsiella trochoidea, Strain CCMP3099" /LENGTH=350 /DNA_ID=CAMNT_0002690393 /DNA_START=1 /DNA_END=1054 /DNA_ORIENTATION=+